MLLRRVLCCIGGQVHLASSSVVPSLSLLSAPGDIVLPYPFTCCQAYFGSFWGRAGAGGRAVAPRAQPPPCVFRRPTAPPSTPAAAGVQLLPLPPAPAALPPSPLPAPPPPYQFGSRCLGPLGPKPTPLFVGRPAPGGGGAAHSPGCPQAVSLLLGLSFALPRTGARSARSFASVAECVSDLFLCAPPGGLRPTLRLPLCFPPQTDTGAHSAVGGRAPVSSLR